MWSHEREKSMIPEESMRPERTSDAERQLSALFERYREALPDPEPSSQFMPRLWDQIEARQSTAWLWTRWSQAFVTAAIAVSLLLTVFLALPARTVSPFYSSTYLELLASAEHDRDADGEIELVRPAAYENPQ